MPFTTSANSSMCCFFPVAGHGGQVIHLPEEQPQCWTIVSGLP
jgi:hypothetical protein